MAKAQSKVESQGGERTAGEAHTDYLPPSERITVFGRCKLTVPSLCG